MNLKISLNTSGRALSSYSYLILQDNKFSLICFAQTVYLHFTFTNNSCVNIVLNLLKVNHAICVEINKILINYHDLVKRTPTIKL
jgi:hypothetical protein